MRLRRKPGGYAGSGSLTNSQRLELMFDCFSFSVAEGGFSNPADYAAAWRRHRDRLIAECLPFRRPSAYWELEIGFVPDCQANGNESEESALLRLGLPLTVAEKSILAGRRGGDRVNRGAGNSAFGGANCTRVQMSEVG
jgi:hypothetical protein